MTELLLTLSLFVKSAGLAGAGVFVVVFVTGTMLFLPASLLTALAGWLFGAIGGALIALLGGVLSSLLAFALGKSSIFPVVTRIAARNRYLKNGLSLARQNCSG